jgi:hypothetical protein
MEDNNDFSFSSLDEEHIETMDIGDTYHGECGLFTVLKYPSEYVVVVENVFKDGYRTSKDVILYLKFYNK